MGFMGNIIITGNSDLIFPLTFIIGFLLIAFLLFKFYTMSIAISLNHNTERTTIRTIILKIEVKNNIRELFSGRDSIILTIIDKGKNRKLNFYSKFYAADELKKIKNLLEENIKLYE